MGSGVIQKIQQDDYSPKKSKIKNYEALNS